MKRFILFLTILSIVSNLFCYTPSAEAQQVYQLTQYMLNDYAYNPGVTGAYDLFKTKINFRKQWTGLDGSPTTAVISLHGNLSEKKSIGIGGLLFFDKTGPTQRLGLQLSYAYHVPIKKDETYLGIGIAANLMQQSINFSELELWQPEDPQLAMTDSGKFGADANLGLYLHGNKYWVGLSLNQLFASKFNFAGTDETLQNALHAYISGGYRFEINDDWDVEPGALLKLVKANNPQVELNAKAIYKQQYWAGLSYRTEDAIALLLGIRLNNGLNLAYSFDLTTSGLNNVSSGSHELTLGFDFSLRK